ncbi:MAG: hypothetical protein DWQ04_02440 [Chloroflexi bacterium]|nr:MAG: hypothetical protein DWQ04_02440 [Chloroflexota bacterium]
METSLIYEIIGYVASALVAISLTMRSILRLRVINLIGGVIFTIYAILIGAYPIVIVNFVIVLINVYYLVRIFNTKEYFTLLEVQPDSQYLDYFLRFHAKEIWQFQPDFEHNTSRSQLILFVLRDLVPAGIVIGAVDEDMLQLKLDFVIPGYRDFKLGRFVYGKTAVLKSKGIHHITSKPGNKAYNNYLLRMGFTQAANSEEFCLEL